MVSALQVNFRSEFAALTGGYHPFPWQEALYEHFVAGVFPEVCDLPTGLGKTSVIAIWLLALAANPALPRRLVYVVNRRTVVDQATDEAERLREALLAPGHLRDVFVKMCAEPPRSGEAPLAISTLRGERADNAEWRRDPSHPSIVIGTIDMIGSRLLFSGYGCGFRTKPLHAGLVGQDTVLVHDEAHLEPAFQKLVGSIRAEQMASREPRPIRVIALSATSRDHPEFTLTPEDEAHSVIRQRLDAKKKLLVHRIGDAKELPEEAARRALELQGRVIVFLTSVEHVERCAGVLRKATTANRVVTLTGTMRGHERDALVRHPVFARFLPKPGESAVLQDGNVYLVATSAGEVGIDISADHMVSDLPPVDSLMQRLGRVNRYGLGEAQVEILREPLTAPEEHFVAAGDSDEEGRTRSRKEDYLRARFVAERILAAMPKGEDGRVEVSPAAMRKIPAGDREKGLTPEPEVRHVDGLLFDRWSYTTITERLPGRPAVADWLHGVAEWEPKRTRVAWRSEVRWLDQNVLGGDSLTEFLADYPLRIREVLSDEAARVGKHLQKIHDRQGGTALSLWLIGEDGNASFTTLPALLDELARRKQVIDGATVVLPPEAGGLSAGLFDGSIEFAEGEDHLYDLGPAEGERVVVVSEGEIDPPAEMRLVRSIGRERDDGETVWWRLFASVRRADDDGSRSSRRPLTLARHLERTEFWARRIAERLALSESECRVLAAAGRWHDLGKRRRIWQRSIRNFSEPDLAKGPMQPSDLSHYRHELGSLHDLRLASGFGELSDEERELAMHLVAAHHGRARPHFPLQEAFDPEVREELVQSLVDEVPRRFARLQRRYGRWGLAWLESLLRTADVLASQDEEPAL
jgi:CRISPR-associated endonuclease/helicase Cas3